MGAVERNGQPAKAGAQLRPARWQDSGTSGDPAFEASSGLAPGNRTRGTSSEAVHRPAVPQERMGSDATRLWLERLPEHIRPQVTSQRHPHVVDRLCQQWERPLQMRSCFWDLLIDQRGNRRGFSFEVFCELSSLESYYVSLLSREQRSAWNRDKGAF